MRTIFGDFGQQIRFSPEMSFWDESTPGEVDEDGLSIVVGTKFKVHQEFLTAIGIRWYRTEEMPGVTSIALWSNSDNATGTITVTGETSYGWQRMMFPLSVALTEFAIVPIIYTATALYEGGSFRWADGIFSSAVINGDLEAFANSVEGNGVYDLSASLILPTTVAAERCFYIDIIAIEQL